MSGTADILELSEEAVAPRLGPVSPQSAAMLTPQREPPWRPTPAPNATSLPPSRQGSPYSVPASVPPHAPAVLAIDLDALRTNYRALNSIAGQARCAGVIKADGYGLGLEPVMKALLSEGCRTFFVATLDEAWRARQVAPAPATAEIYVLGGLFPGSAPGFADLRARPVLNSLAELREWSQFCATNFTRLPAAMHIDTGMSRLGLPAAEVDALSAEAALFHSFELTLIMSHLACADEPGHVKNVGQRQQFEAMRQRLPAAPASLANSAAMLLGPAYHYDLTRPGIALYGGAALSRVPNPMKPVVRLLARILQVRDLVPGDTVGYGAAFETRRAARIATLALGYADGYSRHLSGTTQQPGPIALIGGYPAPIVGRISMDLITLDVTDVPAELVQRGTFAELIGSYVKIDDIAERSGTIGYEVLTRLGRRAWRVYLGQ